MNSQADGTYCPYCDARVTLPRQGSPKCSGCEMELSREDWLRYDAPVLWRELEGKPPYNRNLLGLKGAYFSRLKEIKEFASQIKAAIAENEQRTLVEVLSTLGPKETDQNLVERWKRAVEGLVDAVCRRGDELPMQNLAYQAAVECVRQWPKRDQHTHISGSISEEMILRELKERAAKERKFRKNVIKIINGKISNAGPNDKQSWKALLNSLKGSEDFAEINEKEFLTAFSTGGVQRDMRDICIEAAEDPAAAQIDAICAVARQNFADGVVAPELRMNPFKSFGRRVPSSAELNSFWKELDGRLVETQDLANQLNPGMQFQASFLLSIAREKFAGDRYETDKWQDRFHCLEEWMKMEEFPRQIRGIDIAGGERIPWRKNVAHMTDETRDSFHLEKLREHLAAWKKAEKVITVHLGDFDGHGDVGHHVPTVMAGMQSRWLASAC